MVKSKKREIQWGQVTAATTQMQEQDQQVAAQAAQARQNKIYVPLDKIKDRPLDTRPLNQGHVQKLAESIAVLGLLEPLVVDNHNRLIAGAHRLAAVRRLREENSAEYEIQFPNDGIPVRMLSFDAELDPARALECEVAENEHRKDYTPAEVRNLAERLIGAGYTSYTKGRPKKGEKALKPALEIIIGKNRRTIQRYLNPDNDNFRKSETDVSLFQSQKTLQKIHKSLQSWQKVDEKGIITPKCQKLATQLPKWLKLVEEAIAELERQQ